MIEVEKKFILTKDQEQALTKGAEFLGEQQFTDVYYDDNEYNLTTRDIWFRERDGKFELKLPLNESLENRISDQYQEITDENEITTFFKTGNASLREFLKKVDYRSFCTITTVRRKYKKEGFGIDLDFMDFGYSLAEIELMIDEALSAKEATQKIMEFAKKHGIDTTKIVRGKVVEYLDRKDSKHFQALLEAKVFKI